MSEVQLEKIPGGLWMPLFTLPRNEKKVFISLQEKGIPAYLPLKAHINVQPVISKGKNYCYKRILHVPMFSNYLFAHITPELRSDLYQNRSVLKILPVREEEEENLLLELKMIREIEKLSENGEIQVCNGLQVGQKIKFTEGPFAGWEGVISALTPHDMVAVNINSLQTSIRLKYPAAWCTLCDDEK